MTSSLPPLNPLLQVCGKRTRDIFATGLEDTFKEEEKRYVAENIRFYPASLHSEVREYDYR